jgi:hypothetical protein
MLASLLIAALALISLWVGLTFWAFLTAMKRLDEGATKAGLAALALVGLVLTSPYLAWVAWSAHARSGAGLDAYVPGMLAIEGREFGYEEAWGIGMPGDNETGFASFRLTPYSAAWVRAQSPALRERLDSRPWRPTPASFAELSGRAGAGRAGGSPTADYLGQYGFTIPIPPEHLRRADAALQSSGSVWTAGRGGSITLVSPAQSRVFVFYAG